MWSKCLEKIRPLIVFLLISLVSTGVSAAKYLKDSDKVVDDRWMANTMPVDAIVSCGETTIHKVWPEIECKVTVWLGLAKDIDYDSIARSERLRWLRLRHFRLDTQYDHHYLESDSEYYDMGKVEYILKPSQAPGETVIWLGNYDYSLDGFNDYVSNQAEQKSSEIIGKVYLKRFFVLILALISLAVSLFGVVMLCRKIYAIAKRGFHRIILLPRKISKWNTERQISKVALSESVSLSVRNAHENMESEEVHILRKEIGKALENNETELAKKLSQILTDIDKEKNKS